MILNQFLPPEELQKTLPKKQIDNLDFVLDGIDTKKDKPIIKDTELLGQIHHSINLDKYSKSDFRKHLLKFAPSQIKERYFKECGIKKNISKMSTKEITDCIKKTCVFEWSDNEETKRFVKFFKYPEYLIPEKQISKKNVEIVLGGKENDGKKYEPLKMLLDYQSKIVYKAMKKLEIPNMRFLIQMPTGTGKTRTAMEILALALNENKTHQIVWLANRSRDLEIRLLRCF